MQTTQIADRIKNRRLKLGLSQQAAAELSGMSRQQVIRIEKGRCKVLNTVARLAESIGLQVRLDAKPLSQSNNCRA